MRVFFNPRDPKQDLNFRLLNMRHKWGFIRSRGNMYWKIDLEGEDPVEFYNDVRSKVREAEVKGWWETLKSTTNA